MVKVFAFLSKREGIDTKAFIDYYENRHVPLVLSLAPAPAVYKRNYVVRGDELNREDDSIDFDVVTELVFSDRNEYGAWIEKLGVAAIGIDEERFLERSRTRAYVIEEHTRGADRMRRGGTGTSARLDGIEAVRKVVAQSPRRISDRTASSARSSSYTKRHPAVSTSYSSGRSSGSDMRDRSGK